MIGALDADACAAPNATPPPPAAATATSNPKRVLMLVMTPSLGLLLGLERGVPMPSRAFDSLARGASRRFVCRVRRPLRSRVCAVLGTRARRFAPRFATALEP